MSALVVVSMLLLIILTVSARLDLVDLISAVAAVRAVSILATWDLIEVISFCCPSVTPFSAFSKVSKLATPVAIYLS